MHKLETILVTGGAGFIGSHLVASLLEHGFRVRVLDSFVGQVHGAMPRPLPAGVELLRDNVGNPAILDRALDKVDAVFHFAAEVGVGQSMYEIARYVTENTRATSVLLEALVRRRKQIRKLVVASSMSIYGEGSYECSRCGPAAPFLRPMSQLAERRWEILCPTCGEILQPLPTPESKTLHPASVYAITKQDQEQLCLVVGRAYDIPTVALRFFNVYGPGQALSNPYTGVIAIFSGCLLNRQAPCIFEDGLQSRDFTHVSDIVQANLLALESSEADYLPVNVGTGTATSVRAVAELLARGLNVAIEPTIVGRFREGDIRHCYADISRARSLLGYQPRVGLQQGIQQLLRWLSHQQARNEVSKATQELESFGLVK